MLDDLRDLLGDAYVLTGDDRAKWLTDWTGAYTADPLAVLRPASTDQVAGILRLAHASGTAVVPVSGNTGLTGGTSGTGMLMISLDRLNQIEELDPLGRTATVGAGVILSALHDAADAQDMIFPLTFGARGSAMVGGVLATNAGGSNVLRYGNTRDLVLGLEVVTATGEVMDLMGKLHKDNAGLNLKHLMIGSEGTLGVMTRATVKLFPKPRAYATAMVAMPTLEDALHLLHDLQAETGNAVEAFEFMPRNFIATYLDLFPDGKEPFDAPYDVNILVEVGAIAARDAQPSEDGTIPVQDRLIDLLAARIETGEILDATVAQNDAQRAQMWAVREAAAEIAFHDKSRPFVDTDVAVALADVAPFLRDVRARLAELDAQATDLVVAHLGDGNLHYTAFPSHADADHKDAIRSMIDDVVRSYAGSFSAEHGIGVSKLGSMARRKDPIAVAAMRAIKAALDPAGILNPGKVFPPD